MGTIYLLFLFLRNQRQRPSLPLLDNEHLPSVCIQLPLYNERFVASRLIEAVAAIDYPWDKLEIQVLDDSTDDTTQQLQELVAALKARDLPITMIHRTDRTGYKAGALANGLQYTNAELVAIFDADFVPTPDFLRRTAPYFVADDHIGVVQGRWGHLNAEDNLLTRSQALMIDGHFAIEQFARSTGGLIFTFNGTCGLWRRRCIDDAGGWQHDTLTEDSDLSFRAQMKGWRFLFVPDVVVPGEIPMQMVAFKQQQARWAKGTTQVLLKLGGPLIRSNLPIRMRIMGLLQLLPYPSQLLGLTILLLMPVMILTHALNDLPLGPLGLLSAAVPMMYILSQHALYSNWVGHSMVFPLLMMFSSGLTLNNGRAALSALLGRESEFKRTPKFNRSDAAQKKSWRTTRYAALSDKNTIWELGFGFYAMGGAILAFNTVPSLVLYFLLYAVGFLSVAVWSMVDRIMA